jgi:hypothetical protein
VTVGSDVDGGIIGDPNDFTANDIGILVTDEGANIGIPVINRNNIEGNGVGLQNNSSHPDPLNAKYNWWNDPGRFGRAVHLHCLKISVVREHDPPVKAKNGSEWRVANGE